MKQVDWSGETVPISLKKLGIVLPLSTTVFIAVEIEKLIRRSGKKQETP